METLYIENFLGSTSRPNTEEQPKDAKGRTTVIKHKTTITKIQTGHCAYPFLGYNIYEAAHVKKMTFSLRPLQDRRRISEEACGRPATH